MPPIRSEHFEAVACGTLDELMAAVRSLFHTVLMVEWDSALVVGFEVEERGRRMMRLTAALKRRAESAIVIVYAPAMDEALRQVALEADQTVWLVPRPAEPRPTVNVAARARAQRTLAESGGARRPEPADGGPGSLRRSLQRHSVVTRSS